MITRACISINNNCNIACKYCHFHEKKKYIEKEEMDILIILDNITSYIERNNIKNFKLGFVGNGEPLLDYTKLCLYIEHIGTYLKSKRISAYIITNGLLIDKEKLKFFKEYNINVGFSIDGIEEIHNKYRCNTHSEVLKKIELYKEIFGNYPSMNCTVGEETLNFEKETITFFKKFSSRITFSRMIGNYGISLDEFHCFLNKASIELNVRTGGLDCTMYGGMCGAGINNPFFANNKVFICGNCIDLPFYLPSSTPLDEIDFKIQDFDRNKCFKEVYID